MDQTRTKVTSSNQADIFDNGNRIAFIQADWHSEIVDQARIAFCAQCEALDIPPSQIDFFVVPGSLEIPLQCKLLAKTDQYAMIIAAGLIVDGGIYRHDFVAATVLDAMMQVQLEQELPILSVVLTPLHFEPGDAPENFFFEHFKIKGREAANACAKTLQNIAQLKSLKSTRAA